MKRFIYPFIIVCATLAFASCNESKSENNTAEGAINKIKETLKVSYQEDANHLINAADKRASFYKSLNELSEQEFKEIYPLVKEWKNEARTLSEGELNKLRDEEEALEETLKNLYESLSTRIKTIEEEI